MAAHAQSYRPKAAAELLGIGTATLWRWAKTRPDFPQPIRLSARCTVIPGDQLIAWRDAQAKKVPGVAS
ncbi:MAG: AlpA family phage regulatory protein [Xanthomonadaceae bacterium]|nr:AlpA family phage regulatory protein [Xanthomonadaceae bacterium]